MLRYVLTILTPWETYEGWQDETNGARVAGWAWDQRSPNAPVSVEVYDGDTLIATIVADKFRKDLRDAGKGNGRHGFAYPLAAHIRDRRAHRITVRVAGTPAVLPDTATGSAPQPVTHRDRPRPAPVPYVSLPPYARWFYYTFLKTALGVFPRPVWRLPAALLASLCLLSDVQGRRLDAALLSALDRPGTRRMRWQMHWMRVYLQQTDRLLSLQAARYTQAWVERHVACDSQLPSGGAILIAPHHTQHFLGTVTLRGMVDHLGAISAPTPDPEHVPYMDPTLMLGWRQVHIQRTRVLPYHIFTPHEAGRKGLRLLREGGYLIVLSDFAPPRTPLSPLLGRAWAIPRGAVWLAQRSGKPIIPYMIVPHRFGWRLWIGEPVVPTQDGVRDGIEACLRQSPSGWWREVAMAWLAAPPWDGRERAK